MLHGIFYSGKEASFMIQGICMRKTKSDTSCQEADSSMSEVGHAIVVGMCCTHWSRQQRHPQMPGSASLWPQVIFSSIQLVSITASLLTRETT
jgi:hypothetical protein